MSRSIKRRSKKVGLAPGTLVYVGEKRTEEVKISLIEYDDNKTEEKTLRNIEELFETKNSSTKKWINIDGIHDVSVIEKIGTHFNIHPLVLEDILNTGQRPKMDDYEDFDYIVFKMFRYDDAADEISSEQVSLILGRDYLISFQERAGDVFDGIRERLRAGKGKIRKAGIDYLAYALIDSVVDSYFNLLENIGEKIEDIEDELITDPKPENLHVIHHLRREMILLRKSVWPLREVINAMLRGDSELICESTGVYLRDVYDHTIQIIDTIESYRDIVSGMLDTFLSSVSNKMNEVMKVLTIIATLFIPITFIAGVWGMNFANMPELHWPWIYPYGFWLLIVLITGAMIIYFRRKKWL